MNNQINLEHLEHWLNSQPDGREFNGSNCFECAMCNFLREIEGFKNPVVLRNKMFYEPLEHRNVIEMPSWMDKVDFNGTELLRVEPLTIGNMRKRFYELFPAMAEQAEMPTMLLHPTPDQKEGV